MGLLVGITGPSGAGKTTIINRLLSKHPDWRVVDSYTTRAPRISEQDAKRYIFVSESEFRRLVKTGAIVEFEAFTGHLYGTSRHSLEEARAASPVVLFDLQLEGLRALKRAYPEMLDIGLVAPENELSERLLTDARRATVGAAEQQARLAAAARNNAAAAGCTKVVPSRQGQIEEAVTAAEQIIIEALRD